MKKIFLLIKLWIYTRKFIKAKTMNKTFFYMEKIKKTTELIQKNKGNRLAAFIRQMKQR